LHGRNDTDFSAACQIIIVFFPEAALFWLFFRRFSGFGADFADFLPSPGPEFSFAVTISGAAGFLSGASGAGKSGFF
jgi:hypothetical protein